MINRGKQFEEFISKHLSKYEDVLCQRLYDNMGGYSNITYPADFIVFRSPKFIYLECKAVHKASIPLRNLTQINSMCTIIRNKPNVYGKFIIWFVDKKCTFLIDYRYVKSALDGGLKSLNYQSLRDNVGKYIQEIPATYPRVNGVYDLSILFAEE